jgi:hypothetical protein
MEFICSSGGMLFIGLSDIIYYMILLLVSSSIQEPTGITIDTSTLTHYIESHPFIWSCANGRHPVLMGDITMYTTRYGNWDLNEKSITKDFLLPFFMPIAKGHL